MKLGVRRPRHRPPYETWYPWKEDEDARLVEMYTRGDALADIASCLGRSVAGVACRIHIKGLSRPQPSRKKMPAWEMLGNNLMGSETSGRENGEFLEKEFCPEFDRHDLVTQHKYHIYLKLAIDGKTSQPFSALTLAPANNFTPQGNSKRVVQESRCRYAS